MAPASRMVEFSREGNTLAVRGTLGLNENDAFYLELAELLKVLKDLKVPKAGHKELVLDLSGVDYMSSICIGSIAALMSRARQRDAEVTVIAYSRIARFLDIAGLGTLGEIRIVDE